MSIGIIILFISMLIPIGIPADNNYNPLDGGWVEEIDGVTVLHVSGSYYEMGYQHGSLLEDKIEENIRGFFDFFERREWTYDDILDVWTIQEHYLPDVYKQEIQGMADATGLNYERIAVHNTWMGVFNLMFSCWGASMWGNATVDGKLLHMRSVDGMNMIQDPETGSFLYENQVILIRNPDDAYASISPVFAGDIVIIGGFNEQDVGVSELTVIADDTTFHGINAGYRMRMVLDFADDANEAIEIMNSNRTCCWNFIVSDGHQPMGFALEQSAQYAYAYTCLDKVESIDPFWAIEDVVRRGNTYHTPSLADIEILRKSYDISSLMSFIRAYILRTDPSYITWIQYKSISDEIENRYGTFTYETALDLLRDVYLGETNIMFRFIWRQSLSPRQWVGCPETGDFAICFAEEGREPYRNPVCTFNFYDLLNSEPP